MGSDTTLRRWLKAKRGPVGLSPSRGVPSPSMAYTFSKGSSLSFPTDGRPTGPAAFLLWSEATSSALGRWLGLASLGRHIQTLVCSSRAYPAPGPGPPSFLLRPPFFSVRKGLSSHYTREKNRFCGGARSSAVLSSGWRQSQGWDQVCLLLSLSFLGGPPNPLLSFPTL